MQEENKGEKKDSEEKRFFERKSIWKAIKKMVGKGRRNKYRISEKINKWNFG